jgi:transcriptional regulator with XRE-family HTH domain
MSQLARDTGMSREGLYKALSGEGNPTFATVMKVASALGLRLTFQVSRGSAAIQQLRWVCCHRSSIVGYRPTHFQNDLWVCRNLSQYF